MWRGWYPRPRRYYGGASWIAVAFLIVAVLRLAHVWFY